MANFKYKLYTVPVALVLLCSCHNKAGIVGHWKPTKVTIWDSHRSPLEIDLAQKSFSYDRDNSAFRTELSSEHYRDSIMKLLGISNLILKADSTFQLEDHGFFTQAVYDTAWQGQKSGRWRVDKDRSIMTLTQSTQVSKAFRIIQNNGQSLTLGELYITGDEPITEISLIR